MSIEEIVAQTARYRQDRRTIQEATALIRRYTGSLRPRAIREGVNDGSDDSHFTQPMIEEGRELVEEAHRRGLHRRLGLPPQMDCWLCQQRLTQARRRMEMRRDLVSELGGHCHLCREPVTNMGARFCHRLGKASVITQMLQHEVSDVLAEARTNYVLLCPDCSSKGGRRKVVEQERGFIAIGVEPPRTRSTRGKPRRRPGESLAHYRLRAGGRV